MRVARVSVDAEIEKSKSSSPTSYLPQKEFSMKIENSKIVGKCVPRGQNFSSMCPSACAPAGAKLSQHRTSFLLLMHCCFAAPHHISHFRWAKISTHIRTWVPSTGSMSRGPMGRTSAILISYTIYIPLDTCSARRSGAGPVGFRLPFSQPLLQ